MNIKHKSQVRGDEEKTQAKFHRIRNKKRDKDLLTSEMKGKKWIGFHNQKSVSNICSLVVEGGWLSRNESRMNRKW
jgi:hypothetical protein